MEKGQPKAKVTKKAVHEAAVILGTSSWQARSERFTEEELSVQMSIVGRFGGRPRKLPGGARA